MAFEKLFNFARMLNSGFRIVSARRSHEEGKNPFHPKFISLSNWIFSVKVRFEEKKLLYEPTLGANEKERKAEENYGLWK